MGILLGCLGLLQVTGCGFSESQAASALESMTVPTYNEKGDVLRPEGYRRWVFVGASLGLRYARDGEPADDGPGSFHNVYIQPEAYTYFMEHDVFPEKTAQRRSSSERRGRLPPDQSLD